MPFQGKAHAFSERGSRDHETPAGGLSLIVISQVSPDLSLPGFANKKFAKILWKRLNSPLLVSAGYRVCHDHLALLL